MILGLVIPYRDRLEHLNVFIPYIVEHFKRTKINYKIIVVEQYNNQPFNRSKLLNVGAKILYDDVDYFCFHDVDLFPDKDVSYKIGTHDVIHLCTTLIENKNDNIKNNEFYYGMNFNKYYNTNNIKNNINRKIVGGVVLLKKDIWRKHKWNEIFQGWGYEDQEYYDRLIYYKYKIYNINNRFISMSHKLNSTKCFKNIINNKNNHKIIKKQIENKVLDPKLVISDIKFNTVSEKNFKYYTKVSVDFYESPKNLKLGQDIMKEMLKTFSDICKKYSLKFWTIKGTLLGTIEKKGWLKNDSEVNVCMLLNDFNKLKKIINKELPNDLWFQWCTNDLLFEIYNEKSIYGKIKNLKYCYNSYYSHLNKIHNGLQINVHIAEKYKQFKMKIPEIFPLKEKYFEGINVYVQNNYKDYLNYFSEDKIIKYLLDIEIGLAQPWLKNRYSKLYKKFKFIK